MEHWEKELRRFVKRHSAIRTIRGALLFLAALSVLWIGAAYAGLALNNNTSGRLIVLIISASLTALMAWRFWIPALMVLMGVRKGMSPKEAARSIRRWIPEAEDKILTTIELNEKTEVSELWSAAARQHNQRTEELPIGKASPFTEAKPAFKWMLVPAIIVIVLTAFGEWEEVRTGSERVIAFNEWVDPLEGLGVDVKVDTKEWTEDRPAFLEIIQSSGPKVRELQLLTDGFSENIWLDNKGSFRKSLDLSAGTHQLEVKAAGVSRGRISVTVFEAPGLRKQELSAKYPKYMGWKSEIYDFGKSLTVPRGTKI